MAVNRGRKLLLKVGNGATPEVFTTVAGLRSNTISINDETVDVTNKDSVGWRTLLADAGVKSVSLSASGVVLGGDASLTTLRGKALAPAVLSNYQLVFDNGDMYVGSFQLTSFEEAGEHNGEQTYSVSLESSGPVTFA